MKDRQSADVGTLKGFVMDLQTLQCYLSEEQRPLCIMDERDEGTRLYIQQQRAEPILMGRGSWLHVFNYKLEITEGLHSLLAGGYFTLWQMSMFF